MAKGIAAQMLKQKMGATEDAATQGAPVEPTTTKPKFGSPAWRAMYDKKKKGM